MNKLLSTRNVQQLTGELKLEDMRKRGDIRGQIMRPIKRASYRSREAGQGKPGNHHVCPPFYSRATQKIRGQIRTFEDKLRR